MNFSENSLDFCYDVVGLDVGEVVGLAGGQLHGGARGLLASQVPGNQTMLQGVLFLPVNSFY